MLKLDPIETLARQNCARIAARYAAQPPTLTLASSTSAINGRNHLSPLLSERFKCKICGKVYASFQALGGHTSSHAKHSASGYGGEIASQKMNSKVHECKKCNFRFSTGQALGGHMRRHFDLNAKRKRVDEFGGESILSQSNHEEKMKKIKAEILLKTEDEEKIKTVSSPAETFEKKEIFLFDLNFPPVD